MTLHYSLEGEVDTLVMGVVMMMIIVMRALFPGVVHDGPAPTLLLLMNFRLCNNPAKHIQTSYQ